MKSIFIKVVSICIVASSLFAGTVGGGSDGRLLSTAYYDVMVEGESTMMEYIKYSHRAGFDVNQFNNILTGFGKSATISIKTRVIIPDDIKTKRVYVTVGDVYRYGIDIWGSSDLELNLHSYWNDKKQIKKIVQVSPKTDEFGHRYVDYKLEGFLRYGMQGKHCKINGIFSHLRFKVAPVKRGFLNKFERADIYVLDE